MRRIRVIPVLLLSNGGLVKTVQFKKGRYIGDPINSVKIFNEKEVDELVILDIDASRKNISPDFGLIEEMASEAFMPIAYGGGLRTEKDIENAFRCGLEKVVLNTSFWNDPNVALNIAKIYGSQSITIAMDVRKHWTSKYQLFSEGGKKKISHSLEEAVKIAELHGAGELMLTSIKNEGMFTGYDLPLIESVSKLTELPVIAHGGAKNIDDFYDAVNSGASALAAGSQFVYTGNEKGILINYPKEELLINELYNKI